MTVRREAAEPSRETGARSPKDPMRIGPYGEGASRPDEDAPNLSV
jgi:hypothetical protein